MALESQRHRSIIVGEDLGTVPPSLRRSMAQHNIRRTYVVQFEVKPRARRVLRPISPNALGGLNTHDMPPFAAFWQGLDIRDRRLLRLLDTAAGRRERKRRLAVRTALVSFLQRGGWLAAGRARAEAVLRALLRHLAASPARIVIVNLEDLWLERHPQNVPGTGRERPNWRRKARYAFETFSRATRVLAALREVNRQRKRSTGARP
jgi:4-alpha-glucanotransferase